MRRMRSRSSHDAGHARAQGAHHGAGQGRDVHDVGGALLAGAGQAVGEDEAALGVGVVHHDRLAVLGREDVARARCALASGRFSAQQRMPTTLTSGRSLPSARMVKSTAAAPAMSPFISHMWSPGFRLMPPESKVMPLPTRHDRLLRGLARDVAQDHHARRVDAALAHAQEALVAAGLEARRVEDLDLQVHLLRDLGGALGEVLRGSPRRRAR